MHFLVESGGRVIVDFADTRSDLIENIILIDDSSGGGPIFSKKMRGP